MKNPKAKELIKQTHQALKKNDELIKSLKQDFKDVGK